MKYSILPLLVLMLFQVSAALPDPLDPYINDFAGVLESADAAFMHEMFSLVEYNTTAEVVFVSVESTEGVEPADYALALGEQWGVGQKTTDNGIVILYVKESGKLWVSIGYGIEGILPDSKIGRLLDEAYVPLRDEGNLSQALMTFSFALSEELMTHSKELTTIQSLDKKSFFVIAIFVIVILILFVIFYIFFNRFSTSHSRSRSSSVFSSSSYGGGGSSFGGGSFGGGGAGR